MPGKMPASEQTGQRKADHIRINIEEDVAFKKVSNGLENFAFRHEACPELDLAEVKTNTTLFGKGLKTPVFISSMTGGTEEAHRINLILAEAAQEAGMAMGVGSQRAAIENESLAASFQVRSAAPDILLFANMGAVQLNYGCHVSHMQRAVDMIEADALYLHFNALQEAVQPEGDGNFSGLLHKVEMVCRHLSVPVIAKEVGWGFSQESVERLVNAGISAIDVAGAGGTSWSQVEMHRAPTPRHARIAAAFIDWGIPTAEAIQFACAGAPGKPIFASGGLKNGIEVAKCVALGAAIAGIAGEFIRAAVTVDGVAAVIELAETITQELRISMFAAGAGDLAALAKTPLYPSD